MCGIAGFFSTDAAVKPPAETLKAMAAMISHRGPDGEGFHFEPGIGLAHRRLSIIDLALGAQPLYNEDRSICVVFNGEIENYLALRDELRAKGHVFRTNSDTEVLVHLYEEKGEGMVELLRGFFAFAVWDSPSRKMLLARDRIGEKPLYYLERPDGVWFASEAKALLVVPGFERRLDPEALDAYLAFLHVPYENTFFAGMKKLLPSQCMVLSEGRVVKKRKYFTIPEHGIASARADFPELFSHVVKEKLKADVDLGVFLSSGIDSGLIAAATKKAVGSVRTFTMGLAEDPSLDEREPARRAAEYIGADARFQTLPPADFPTLFSRFTWHMDEPSGGSAAILLMRLAEQMRAHVKVALSGDGGDEAFAGYPRHRIGYLRQVPTPSNLMSLVHRHGLRTLATLACRIDKFPFDAFYYDLFALFKDEERRAVIAPELHGGLPESHVDAVASALAARRSPLSKLQNVDYELYLPSTLHPADRVTMAAGLESRAPFLDYELVSYAMNLADEEKLGGGEAKPFLGRTVRALLPEESWHLPKRGFPSPLKYWLKREGDSFLSGLLLGERSRRRGIFRGSAVERLVARHKVKDSSIHLFALASVEAWARVFIDPPTPPGSAAAAVELMRHD